MRESHVDPASDNGSKFVFESALSRNVTVPPRRDVFVNGSPVPYAAIIEEGWFIEYNLLANGRRQGLRIALPGDFVGLCALIPRHCDHSLGAITAGRLQSFNMTRMADLVRQRPELGATVLRAAGRREAMLSEQVIRLGRKSAVERLAHLLLELWYRLRMVGHADSNAIDWPLTQELVADVIGLSIMHVYRTMKQLTNQKLIVIDRNQLVLTVPERLAEIGEFEPGYLSAHRDTEAPRDLLSRRALTACRSQPPPERLHGV